MTALLVAAGLSLVAAALVDLSWTTVAAGSGAAPLTGRLTSALWMGALALHRRRPSHALLSFAGVAVVFAVLAAWLALVLGGWLLVFSAADAAVLTSTTREPADFVSRMYFTGYTVFTLGNGDYVPGDGLWQLATVVAVGTGLVLVTMAITYLVPVASAVAARRQLASYIASLGSTPQEIVGRGWNGSSFSSLSQHLTSLTPILHTSRQQHLAYPVLHYFHSQEQDSAAAVNITNLSQAIYLLRHAVAPDSRPDAGVLEPVDRAITGFLETLRGAHLKPGRPVSLPALEPIRNQNIPVVSDAEFEATEADSQERRALLGGLLDDDGWRTQQGGP